MIMTQTALMMERKDVGEDSNDDCPQESVDIVAALRDDDSPAFHSDDDDDDQQSNDNDDGDGTKIS